jgi:hypothetical protein
LDEYRLATTDEPVNKVSDDEFVVVASNLNLKARMIYRATVIHRAKPFQAY